MIFQLEWRSNAVKNVSVSLSGQKQTMNWGEDGSWTSPKFRAEVTSAGEPPLQFELTVLDNADLSGLK
jgi:hypothetical protein